MKKQIIFRGVGTALITPFKNSRIDYAALSTIIERQIEAGVSALIVGGTTGEAATLSDIERYTLFEFVRERTCGRTKLVFGTGTNDTRAALRHTKRAEAIGCDGVLVVTPYYNKGTFSGVTRHYEEISDATSLPIILYNVPSRTGVNLTSAQLDRLVRKENIVAIKEAGDSLDRFAALASYGDELGIYAGGDAQTFSVLSLGGLGVISVLSNPLPRLMCKICELFSSGEIARSRRLEADALPIISALFAETNPAPVKYLMHKLGLIQNELRLPLMPIEKKTEEMLDKEFSNELIKKYL